MNILDKAIEVVAPGLALKRQIDRHNLTQINAFARSGYKAGQTTRRRTNVQGGLTSEDSQGNFIYTQMISNAMDLYRNGPLTKSAVEVIVDALMGDMLYVLFDGALYPIEGVNIRTPYTFDRDKNIVQGVRLAKTAPFAPTHYYVWDRGEIAARNKFKRYNQRQVFFAPSEPWRSSMLRGVPYLHGVIDALTDSMGTHDNVRNKVKFDSMWFSISKKGAISDGIGRNIITTDSTTGTKIKTRDADYGMALEVEGSTGPLNDNFQLTGMENPSTQTVQYLQHDVRIISAGIGIPYEVLMHAYLTNYTASRAARVDFKNFVMRKWNWRNKVLNQPVWNWRIAKAIRAGELPPAPTDSEGRSLWYKVKWSIPHFEQIDEGKETTADIKQWGAGQESMDQWAAERNTTKDALLDAHDKDIEDMQRRAKKLGITLDVYMSELFKQQSKREAQ
jgi:hypothetical protein